MFNNATENNTFITKINVHKPQTEYSENHLAQIHVYINKQTKILIQKLYSWAFASPIGRLPAKPFCKHV